MKMIQNKKYRKKNIFKHRNYLHKWFIASFFILALGLLLPGISAQWKVGVAPSVYYHFDNSYDDSSGKGLTLNAPTTNIFVSGIQGQAVNLTVPKQLNHTAVGSYQFGLNNFSVCYWFKVNWTTADNTLGMFNPVNTWYTGYNTNFPLCGFGICGTQEYINDNIWHHACFVRNGTGTNQYSIYLNGTLEKVDTLNTDLVGTNDFNIDGHDIDRGQQIDELVIWNNTWLDNTTVAQIFNDGVGRTEEVFAPPIINSASFNSTTYIGLTEGFVMNISYNSTQWTSISAILNYNGINYAATKVGIGDSLLFTKSLALSIPSVNTFYFNITYGNATETHYLYSQNYIQNVNDILFGLCNSTLITKYINFTFKDETSLIPINASIPTSNFSYWLGDGSVKRSILFINNTENPSYAFCFSPGGQTLHLDYTMNYIGGLYPQRVNNPTAETFTNITTNRTLYLLSSSDGVTDTTQVLSQSGQVLSGVAVTISRQISGVQTVISQGTTGDDGSISFWLNPDFLHTFVFTKLGYTTLTTSFYPSNLGRTVTIESSTETNSTDCSIGTIYSILPTTFQLLNNTDYTFSFTLNSSYWVITNFRFDLKNSSGSILDSASATTNGGTISKVYNTVGLNNILMDYSWTTGKCSSNYTKMYVVYDDTVDSQWSIRVFFEDLGNFATQGIFGLDNFGLSLIIFITMFVLIGIMSLRFGFTSPGAISIMIFAVVLFFDIGVGILPGIAGERVSHFITLFTGILALGLGFREWQR